MKNYTDLIDSRSVTLLRAAATLATDISRVWTKEELGRAIGFRSSQVLRKYLALLCRAGLVRCLRGRAGGYRLNRFPDGITLYDVIMASGSPLAPSWHEVSEWAPEAFGALCGACLAAQDVFRGMTLADLVKKGKK